MVVGWAIDTNQTALLVTNALGMAVQRIFWLKTHDANCTPLSL
jgi:hypothetical protein